MFSSHQLYLVSYLIDADHSLSTPTNEADVNNVPHLGNIIGWVDNEMPTLLERLRDALRADGQINVICGRLRSILPNIERADTIRMYGLRQEDKGM